MRSKPMLLSGVLALGLGVAPFVAAQDDELEVTLEVLDAVEDVEGVLLSLESENDSDAPERAESDDPSDRDARPRDEEPASVDPVAGDHDDDVHADIDERDLEDHDVEEDAE